MIKSNNFKIVFCIFTLVTSSCAVKVPVNVRTKEIAGAQYKLRYDLKARPTIATYVIAGASIGTGAYIYQKKPKLGIGIAAGGLAVDFLYYLMSKQYAHAKNDNSSIIITKYNKKHNRDFSYPIAEYEYRSAGQTIKYGGEYLVYDLNEMNEKLSFNSKENIDFFASSRYSNRLSEKAIRNTNPCLWADINSAIPSNSFKELTESGILRCNPDLNLEKFVPYFKKYPTGRYGQELEDLFIKTYSTRDVKAFGFGPLKEFSNVRPALFNKLEPIVSDNLNNSLNKVTYSGTLYNFIDIYPKNSRVAIFKMRADELKKKEDAEELANVEKRRREREWRNDSSSNNSNSTSDRSEKIMVKLLETKEEINILSANRIIYKYRLKQGNRTKNIEVYYTAKDDSWSISCDFFGAPRSREEAIEKCLDDFDCNGCEWEWEH